MRDSWIDGQRLTKHLPRVNDALKTRQNIPQRGMPHCLYRVDRIHRVKHRPNGRLIRPRSAQAHDAQILKMDAKLARLDIHLIAPSQPTSAQVLGVVRFAKHLLTNSRRAFSKSNACPFSPFNLSSSFLSSSPGDWARSCTWSTGIEALVSVCWSRPTPSGSKKPMETRETHDCMRGRGHRPDILGLPWGALVLAVSCTPVFVLEEGGLREYELPSRMSASAGPGWGAAMANQTDPMLWLEGNQQRLQCSTFITNQRL
jgi:hypothetical protein